MKFPGFTVLYTESRDEDEKEEEKPRALPLLKKDDALKSLGVYPDQRFTQAPPRFTEATLVKMLEQKGIGRPSTYAPILSTIVEREYVTKTRGVFQPTELGFVVNDLLVNNFSSVVDVDFTAKMEDELDDVARNERKWVDVINEFYTPFAGTVETAKETIEKVKVPDKQIDEACPQCGKPIVIKSGRFGKFLACSGYPECRYTRPYMIKMGAKCPSCGAELVERMSKKRRVFYGCSKYPECKFATFYKPYPQPCPKCGGLVTASGKGWKKCTKCDYREKVEEEKQQ
jgi:DNA topoisomerase-1